MTTTTFDPWGQTVPPHEMITPEREEFLARASKVITSELDRPVSAGNSEPKAGRGLFVFDIETVPDDSRFPRPKIKEQAARDIDPNEVLKTVKSVETAVVAGLSITQAETLLQAEREGKNREGAVKALLSVSKTATQEVDQWHRLSADPFRCRIVALACQWYDAEEPDAMVCTNEDEEREALEIFWSYHESGRRCGFNIASFDDRVILWRSLILGVRSSRKLSLKKYDEQRLDLMQILFPDLAAAKGNGLKKILPDLGITPQAEGVDGSMVLGMIDEGQWDAVLRYVISDVDAELQLLKLVQTVAEVM